MARNARVTAGLLTSVLWVGAAHAHELVGRVTDARSGAVVHGVRITAVCLSPCSSHANARTDASGEFRVAGVLPGDYVVLADDHRGYRSTVWPAGHCSDVDGIACRENSAVRVVGVPDDAETTHLGFLLEPVAVVAVRVVDGVTHEPPYEGASGSVSVHAADGAFGGARRSLAEAAAGLHVVAGRYRVSASNGLYRQTFYPDVACPAPCGNDVGEVVDLAPGDRLELVVRLVPAYGVIRGRVVDAVAGTPLDKATVLASWRTALTDASGAYELRVPSGPTALSAQRMPTHAISHRASASNLVVVPTAGEVAGVDFALARTGSITGTMRGSNGAPVSAEARATSSAGTATSVITDDEGRFVLSLAAGTYTVSAHAPGYLSQHYRDGACAPTCASATPIAIASDARREGIDFVLELGAAISGRLTAADHPRPRGTVAVFRESGERIATVEAPDWRDFTTPLLGAGRYRLVATADGYAPTAWPDIRCADIEGCAALGRSIEIAGSTAVAVTVRMQRPPRGEVVVRALDEITGEELEPVRFDHAIYDYVQRGDFYPHFVRDGIFVPHASVTCRRIGWDWACDVPEGVYRVLVYAPSYGDMRWPDVACEANNCAADAGRAITVRAGESQSISVTLQRFGRIGGAVRAADGATLYAYSVEVFDTTGRRVRALPGTSYGSWESGYVTSYTGELAPGRYFVRSRNPLAYLDQLHAGIACPDGSCDPLSGTAIEIGAHVDTPLEFNLGGSQRLFQAGFE